MYKKKIIKREKNTVVEKSLVTTINELTTGTQVGSTNHDLGWP